MTQQQNLADDIEANVAGLYDVISARPVATSVKVGQHFYATDTNQEFLSDGTNWREIAQDTQDMFATLGVNRAGAAQRRGKSIIATTEGRTNVAFGLLTTPDRVQNIVLPTDGLICVAYKALWDGGNGNGRAAIFIGANQLKVAENDSPAAGAPVTQAAVGFGSMYKHLHTAPFGITSFDANINDSTDVTTGQVVGGIAIAWSQEINGTTRTLSNGAFGGNATTGGVNVPFGGPCYIFAAAGTYDISIQFKCSSGTVNAKQRKLWVWTMGF
jgi:hypothetical protein